MNIYYLIVYTNSMNNVLGHDSALVRLYYAWDHLGYNEMNFVKNNCLYKMQIRNKSNVFDR